MSAPRKSATSLQEQRKQKYGIGSSSTVHVEKYGRGKRSASKNIDYLKLNEGLDTPTPKLTSPKRPKVASHTPVRSGPTPQRQIAQKQVTINPTVTTISTVKTKKDSKAEPPKADLFGVPSSSSVAIVTSTPEYTGGTCVTDAFFGVPENADSLPDLGQSKDITTDDILNQPSSQTLEAGSTEEELDATDTLLSLSTVRENLDFRIDDFEDNSLLMLIGGQPPIEDVAPEPLRLGQVEVDSEIARIITAEEQDQVVTPDTTALSGVPDDDHNSSREKC